MQTQKPFYHPLFLVFLSFVSGIFVADNFVFAIPWQDTSVFAILLFSLLSLLILWISNILSRNYASKSLFGCICLLCFFSLGVVRTCLQNRQYSHAHYAFLLEKEHTDFHTYKVCLRENPIEKPKSWKAEVDVLAMDTHPNNSTKSWQNTEGKAILYFQKDSTNAHLEYGQCVWVKLVLKKITNEPSIPFDYARFLARKQIYYQGYAQSQNTFFCSEYNGNFLIKKALILQSNLIHILTKVGLDGREFTLASALLLGQMGDMDEDLQQAYRSAGLIHILCVSGLHIGLFATVLLSILSFLQNKRWLLILKLSIVCACIWIYAFIVGLSPSVLRSTVMFSFVSLGQCFNRENDIYRSLLSSAFLLLLINPYTLFSIGFQLSYLAVIGIVCFQKLFFKIWRPKYKICKYLWELIGVSISAQLATSPLIIYYFHQFPNYFLLSNIVGSPLSSLLLPLGMSILFLAHIYLPIAMGMAYLFIWTLRILNTSVLYIEKLPHALWNIQLSLWGSLLLYALILFSFGAIVKQKKQFVFASLCSLWGLIIVF